jgi:small-conductance mechanosensitive channel
MAKLEVTLEQRLSVLMSSLEEAQGDSVALLQGLSKEREALQLERKQWGQLRQELPKATEEGAHKAAQNIVEQVARGAVERLQVHQKPLIDEFQGLLSQARSTKEQVKQALRDLEGGWKMPSLKLFGLWGVGAVVMALVSWMIWGGFKFKEQLQEREHAFLVEETALLKPQYEAMKKEMETWKQAGIGRVELVPCPSRQGVCVLVDKKQGAFGPNKDLFVPASGTN